MKKIDLHIHTVPADNQDVAFVFDITKFQEYVDDLSLNAVAITNHNLFDIDQFRTIKKDLQNTTILPGIEIDFEGSQLLLISDDQDLDNFKQKCDLINNEFSKSNKITIAKLEEIFVDLTKYLLIPHYEKRPKIKKEIVSAMQRHIFAGEVKSPKNFYRIIKEKDSLTPVLFSDARISTKLVPLDYQGRQTFIKTNSDPLSLDTIKTALADKNKVFLSNTGRHEFFQIFSDGQELSNGLNVILGKRSSGKTFLLDQLKKNFDVDGTSVKYIKQFELVKNDEKEFEDIVEKEKSAVREKYLHEFKSVVEEVIKIDRRDTNYTLEKYVETLLEFASSEKLHDEFSNAILFKENIFQIRLNKELEALFHAIKFLLVNDTYRATISKYIPKKQLDGLLIDLKKQYETEMEEKLKKQWINNLTKNIREKLEHKTSSPKIEDVEIDFYKIKIEKESVKRFNAIADAIKKEKIIHEEQAFGKFKIIAIATQYNGAQELLDESGMKIRFAQAYKKYGSPISFLNELFSNEKLEKSELYKYFCRISYQVLNEYDKRISGGERAEFNLLKSLQDARQYDMLLLDEPESSFDNMFLNDTVNKEIKEMSKELPIIVVTHSSTVGILMQPDYILYTQRRIIDGKDEYLIFSGSPGDKEFHTADNSEKIDSYHTLLDSLEAGKDTYIDKKEAYDKFEKII